MKRFVSVMLAILLCAGLLAGCGGGNSGGGNSGGGDAQGPVNAAVTVWGPQEDQSEDNGKWLQTQCEAFAAAHPEWNITFNYGVCPENDAKILLGTDPAAGADVYLFANDQIPILKKVHAIAELGGSVVDAIRANNSETTVSTVIYEDSVYGVPFTGNTWFMYYDKSVFSEEDVKSLDAMLEKGKVAFPLDNSWYIAAFYVANGCTLFGETGGDAAAGIDFSGEKAVQVTDYLVDLAANPNFSNGDVSTNAEVRAFFSGTWDYQIALDAYGSNLGIVPPPSFTLNGEPKQMKAFAGTKAVGVNPAASLYKEHPEIAVALAAYLGGADAQKAHYETRSILPIDNSLSVNDALAQAQMDTLTYASIVQPIQDGMANYWGPAESMGKELAAGAITHANAAKKTEMMNTSMNTSAVK